MALAIEHCFFEMLPILEGNLALSYLRTGQIDKAKQTLEQVFVSFKPGSSGVARAEAYMYRGEVYAIEGDYDEAIAQVKASKVISGKHGYIAELAEATRILSEIYVKNGEFEKAYNELKDYIDYSEILSEDAKQGAVTKLKLEFDMNKKDIEADLLKEQYNLLEEKNRKIQEQSNELERLIAVLGRQNDDLHQSAIEDYLTGVYNRKYFTLKLREEFSIAKEKNRNMAFIILDIDHFKNINDTFGHLVGDEVIKHVSAICEELLDSDSIIGRFGGDEFVVLRIDATIEDARLKAEDFIEGIRLDPMIIDKTPISVTFSIGIADNHYLEPKNSDEMIHIADQGLYQAKESGRNRCCQFIKPEEAPSNG
jgi:diguanylate cyclase (GGDEF)-like protein